MDTPEAKVHSFIVKVWLEEEGDEAGSACWHGHVTHVPSGERRYLRELSDILGFIKPYVAEIGAQVTRQTRSRSWLPSWTRRKR
jgi:hypothetical protein